MSQTPFFFTPAQQFSIISKPSWSSLFVTSSSNTYIFKPQQPNMTHCHGTMTSPVSTLIHGPFKALLNSDWSETAGLRKFEFDYLKKNYNSHVVICTYCWKAFSFLAATWSLNYHLNSLHVFLDDSHSAQTRLTSCLALLANVWIMLLTSPSSKSIIIFCFKQWKWKKQLNDFFKINSLCLVWRFWAKFL